MNTPNIVWLLIFYAVGFIAGYLSQKDKIAKRIENAKKEILHSLNPDSVGPVNRPTAKQLFERTDPKSKLVKEEKEEMKKILKRIVI